VYARPVRKPERLGAVALAAALAFGLTACRSSTPGEEVASFCEDLLHLQATVTLLAHPASEATVGLVRAALQKLDPTFEAIDRSSLVPEALRSQLGQATHDFGEAMEGVGDDDPAAEVAADVADARQRLVTAYAAVVGVLGCGQPSPTPAV
jgi:hypothetical protein